ncbi:MAG: TIGR03619 family F420-dependent LLM class oxidoreductase [Acidimicrobiales bacterium]|nr:TIGR03619 family F420-dependent LLM class oxidoreductase [Acidimicrobiales bacterium]
MRLGIHLPQYGRAASADAITTVARRAEELGFQDVWVSDHVVVPAEQGYPSPYLYEPLLTMAWAAAATSRVRLGTSVLVVPHHHPLGMANSLASLDKLSGGRLTLGVGVGWSAAEFAALDQDFATRGKRMDEALDIYRAAWETDPVSHDGGFYDFEGMKLQPKPEARIPIWVGGGADAAIRRAARHDGYQGISTEPDEMAKLIQRLKDEGARDDFVISYRTGWDPNGMDPEQIREEAAAYAEAGVHHVVSAPWRSTVEEWVDSMEQLTELVPFDPAE